MIQLILVSTVRTNSYTEDVDFHDLFSPNSTHYELGQRVKVLMQFSQQSIKRYVNKNDLLNRKTRIKNLR